MQEQYSLTEEERDFVNWFRENEALEFIWMLKEVESLAAGAMRKPSEPPDQKPLERSESCLPLEKMFPLPSSPDEDCFSVGTRYSAEHCEYYRTADHVCLEDAEGEEPATAICADPLTEFCVVRLNAKRKKYHLGDANHDQASKGD